MELVPVYTNNRIDTKKHFISVIKYIISYSKVIITFILSKYKYL